MYSIIGLTGIGRKRHVRLARSCGAFSCLGRSVSVGLLLYAAPASAQQIRSDASLGVRALYESNPLRSRDVGAKDGGDLRVTPTISLDVTRSVGRYGVYVKGDAGYDFYRRFSELNSARVEMEAGARARVAGRCFITVAARADIMQSDPGDVGLSTTNRSRTTTLSGTGRCPRPAGLFPELRVTHVAADNSDPLRESFDYRLDDVTAALLYARPSLGTLGVYYYFGSVSRSGVEQELDPGVDFHRAGLTFDRAVALRLQARAAIGYHRARPKSDDVPGYSGVDWKAELRWLPTPERSVVVSYDRQLRAESNLAATFVLTRRAAIEADFRVGGRTRLAVGARNEVRNLRGARAFFGLPARQRDRTLRLAATLSYQLTPKMLLGAEVTHARRVARPDIFNYQSTGAGLRIRYTL
jgi:hypothetical protein